MIRKGGNEGTGVGSPARANVRPAVRFVISGFRRALIRVAGTAFLGGAAEALFLVVVTRAAFAITAGAERVGVVAGWYLSMNSTLLLALGLVGLRIGLASYATWQSARVVTSSTAGVRKQLADGYLAASWEVQQNQRTGSLQQLLTAYTAAAGGLIEALSQSVVAGANLLALMGIAIAVDPLGALVLVGSVALLGLVLRPLRSAVRRRAQAENSTGMEFATAVGEISDLGLELHVFHVQEGARTHVHDLIERSRVRGSRLRFAMGLTTPAYTGMAYLALLGALSLVALSSSTSLTSLGASMLVMLRSLSYGQALQVAWVSITANAPALEEITQQLHVFDDGRRDDGGEPVGSIGGLTADGVWFSYLPGTTVLRDLSFTIEPREVVGIVGPSGSGKSTLIQLLLGLREPSEGRVLADGRDLVRLDRAELARKITFVPQAPHLVAGTVASNIRFMRPWVTQDQIEEASRLAQFHDDVTRFPAGYDHEVGERGGHLSGGQQQRLCIARALVEDPDVLLMDEPTSSLDVRSENLIRAALVELRDQMSVIVIAHRLSTLDICDRIMVIQEGELKAFDTPAALERSNEFYRESLLLSGMR